MNIVVFDRGDTSFLLFLCVYIAQEKVTMKGISETSSGDWWLVSKDNGDQ